MELDESITNDDDRAEFLEGFSSGLESVDVTSESELTIDGTPAYQYDMTNETNEFPDQPDVGYETSLIVFDYQDGLINFVFTTLADSDQDYSNEFEDVLDSITFTDDTANEAETVTDKPAGNDIVLGEPIELGDYTLTIQNYSLGVDYEGNDALIIEYDWANNSEESTSPFITFTLKAFQDGVETDMAMMVDGVDLSTGQKEIRPDGKIEGAQDAVMIADMTKPLELELDELFSFTSDPYIAIIDLSTLD